MKTLRNEQGFVLVTGLLTLVVLTFLGLAATTNTSIELKIAGNDRLNQENFYDAEATLILGTEILEQNFNCATGFSKDLATSATYPAPAEPPAYYYPLKDPSDVPPPPDLDPDPAIFNPHPDCPDWPEPSNRSYSLLEGQIRAYDQGNDIAFWRNPQPKEWSSSDNTTFIFRDIYCPAAADAIYAIDPAANIASGADVGYLYMGGFSEMLPGGALQMAAGYEGKGKGSASGGVAKILDIYSVYNGALNSQTCVVMGWRHLIGSEGDCIYD